MTAGRHDIEITRGDDKAITVRRFTDATKTATQNLTGRAYIAQIKVKPDDTTPVAAFTVDVTNAATGVLVLRLAHAATAALQSGVYHWDLQETSSGVVSTLLAGIAIVKKDTSR